MNRLLLAGLVMIVAGILVVALGSAGQGGVSTGGFVLLGPIPIVFGSGPSGWQIATLALVAGILMIVLLSALAWRFRSLRGKD
jgi:uncharacterized membrane protein